MLDKVDLLKGKAAKRRYLQEGIAALRNDRVPDHLQLTELALLEEALQELDT